MVLLWNSMVHQSDHVRTCLKCYLAKVRLQPCVSRWCLKVALKRTIICAAAFENIPIRGARTPLRSQSDAKRKPVSSENLKNAQKFLRRTSSFFGSIRSLGGHSRFRKMGMHAGRMILLYFVVNYESVKWVPNINGHLKIEDAAEIRYRKYFSAFFTTYMMFLL